MAEEETTAETAGMPPSLIDLVRFLCRHQAEVHRVVNEAARQPEGEVSGYLFNNVPIIQGLRVQMNLEKIGKQEYDSKEIYKAVEWLLEQDKTPATAN